MVDSVEVPRCAIHITKRSNQRSVGAALLRRSNEIELNWRIDLHQFLDNEQFSNFDSLLLSIGPCDIVLIEDLEDQSKVDNRKIHNLLKNKDFTVSFAKKAYFRTTEVTDSLAKLQHTHSFTTNVADAQSLLAYDCVQCLIQKYDLLNDSDNFGKFEVHLGALDKLMKLDSSAAEAINLLPHPSHPSKFGSIFGVLNRCKTKMGQRLLERWLRQPLLDHIEINHRLDVVEAFKNSTIFRNQLLEGPLHNVPDLELIVSKMEKKSAGVGEIFRIYVFARSIPKLLSVIEDFIQSSSEDDKSHIDIIRERFLSPLNKWITKFALYQQLVEHVLDLSQLPDLVVRPQHDAELQDMKEEIDSLMEQAEGVLRDARGNWASFTDVKLESDSQHGFVLRTTRGDDEKQLRANNSKVQILSIQKNGVHFTTPALRSIGEDVREQEAAYKTQQQEVIRKALDTACTYMPVVEACCAIVAELDVLLSFATVAALSPDPYVRPTVLPRGAGVFSLQGARHPCVELMDDVRFIANDYDLKTETSAFQIITGPNMGGKSTYIRTAGSIAVMAQIGCFVPCTSASISVIDCVLARVGAGDAVQRGVSTFMAEMLEASVILRTATRDSLIIIDELGRGTSTFDGFGLAWAISEHIVSKIGCLCFFATHFHELTALSQQYSSAVNKHVVAHTTDNQLVMLYTVQPGPCTQSFGIHVARMAAFPARVLDEAKRKADQLECVTDVENESVLEKHKRMKSVMQSFSELPVSSMSASEIRSSLNSLFSSYELTA